jgi:hypothetical protein
LLSSARSRPDERSANSLGRFDSWPTNLRAGNRRKPDEPCRIPVFYGALDIDTAVEETLAHAGAGGTKAQVKVCWGTFRTITPFTLVNFTSLPQIPGFFSAKRADREPLGFLHSFTSDVARPIPPDGREHSEYAPTQVVAEYFRHVYKTPDGRPVDGILYPSSKTGVKPARCSSGLVRYATRPNGPGRTSRTDCSSSRARPRARCTRFAGRRNLAIASN